MNIEHIEWIDSYGCSSSWSEITDSLIIQVTCHSVGFVLKEDDRFVVIAGHYHKSYEEIEAVASACGEMVIPKCSIVKRELLKEFL